MSFASRFLAGSAAAAGLTYYYHININAEAARLSSELHALSERLVASVPRAQAPVSWEVPVPQRAGLKEGVKARWNETVYDSLSALRTFEWSNVMTNIGSGVGAIKAKLSPAVEEVVEQGRQV